MVNKTQWTNDQVSIRQKYTQHSTHTYNIGVKAMAVAELSISFHLSAFYRIVGVGVGAGGDGDGGWWW